MLISFSFAPSLLVSLAALGVAQKCPMQFDARIPSTLTPAQLDTKASPFNPDFVKGKDLLFSKIIKLSPGSSLFDKKASSQTATVTLSDESIFVPNAKDMTSAQTGLRRCELLVASNNGTDGSTTGIKTLHFSLQKSATQPLNSSHEYMFSWMEDNKYSNNQWNLRWGTLGDQKTPNDDPDTLMFFNTSQYFAPGTTAKLIYQTKFTPDVWHNFGIYMDFRQNLTQLWYSQNMDPLKNVTGLVLGDLSGQGQFHFGLLKKPTNVAKDGDMHKSGFQEANINEGINFGGIFEEDSTGNCVSTAP